MSASNPCPSCGASNAPVNLFCTNCGKPLAPSPAPPSAVPPTYAAPAPSPYPYPYPAPFPAPYPYPYYGPPPRRATFSTILSAMFDVWTKNFLNFFLVFLLLAVLTGLVNLLLAFALVGEFAFGGAIAPGFQMGPPGSVDLVRIVLFGVLVAIATVIINSIVVGGMTEYSVRRLRGEPISLEQALRRGFERFLSILGAGLLIGLMIAGIVIVPLLLIFFAILGLGGSPGALALVCGGILLFVVGGIIALFVVVATILYAPAIMMEDRDAVGSLSRSWELTKGYRWSLFAALLVTAILSAIISAAVTFPAGLAENAIVDLIASALVSGLIGSWFVILAAVAYDLIVRTPTYGPPPYGGPIGAPPMTGPQAQPPPSAPPTTPPTAPPTGP